MLEIDGNCVRFLHSGSLEKQFEGAKARMEEVYTLEQTQDLPEYVLLFMYVFI